MDEHRIPLSRVLDMVNAEIRRADETARSAGHAPVMAFEGCELEFAVDIETKADGKVGIWVMKLGGSAKKTDSNTITIRYRALSGTPAPDAKLAPALGEPGAVSEYARVGRPVEPARVESPAAGSERGSP